MVNNINRDFKSHYRRAGIKPTGTFTIHTLRKCCAQNWADNLPLNVTQYLMGHSKAETTMEYYSQVDEAHEKKASLVIQQIIDNGLEKSDARVTPEVKID